MTRRNDGVDRFATIDIGALAKQPEESVFEDSLSEAAIKLVRYFRGQSEAEPDQKDVARILATLTAAAEAARQDAEAERDALRTQLTEAKDTAMYHLASIAELEGRVKMYLSEKTS